MIKFIKGRGLKRLGDLVRTLNSAVVQTVIKRGVIPCGTEPAGKGSPLKIGHAGLSGKCGQGGQPVLVQPRPAPPVQLENFTELNLKDILTGKRRRAHILLQQSPEPAGPFFTAECVGNVIQIEPVHILEG